MSPLPSSPLVHNAVTAALRRCERPLTRPEQRMPRGGPRECGLSRPCMTLVTTSAAGLPPRASHAYAESRMPPTMRWLAWLVRLTIAPVFLGALLMLAHSPTSVHNVAASLGLTVL